MTQIAGDGGLLARPVVRTAGAAAPGRADRSRDRLPRLPPRHRARAPQRRRPGRHGRGDALRRRRAAAGARTSACRAGCGRASRCRPRAPSRRWNLAFGVGAWQISGRDFDPDRIDARPRHGTTERWTFVNHVEPRAPDAHPRLPVPRARAAAADPSIRATGWAGRTRSACCPNETVTVLAVVRALQRPLRVPLPRARARRQGDDAADGGDAVKRRCALAARRGLAALAGAPAASGQGPVVQAVDGTEADNYNNRWSPATVTIKAGETRHVELHRLDRVPQRRLERFELELPQRRSGDRARRPRPTRSRRPGPTRSSARCTRRR